MSECRCNWVRSAVDRAEFTVMLWEWERGTGLEPSERTRTVPGSGQ